MTEEPFSEAETESDSETNLKTVESSIINPTRGFFNEEDVTDTEMKDSRSDKRKILVIKEIKLTQIEKKDMKRHKQKENRRTKKRRMKLSFAPFRKSKVSSVTFLILNQT